MSLSFDPDQATEFLSKADRSMARLIRRAGPFTLRPERLDSPFLSLLRAIVYQQLSGKAAATIYGRLGALFPRRRRIRPEDILSVRDEQLRSVGLSRNKMAAIQDLATKTLDGTVPSHARLLKLDDAEILARLVQVRGIGPWTVEMLLMFKLGRPDVLPVSDLGVRKGFLLTYGGDELPAPSQLLKHGERWRPYRTVASWYLWRAVDLERGQSVIPLGSQD